MLPILGKLIIALLHYDVTIKIFIKILLFNARDHGRLAVTKQRKFMHSKLFQKPYKFPKRSGIVSKRPKYYLVHMNTHYIQEPEHFSLNCFARSKSYQIFYWI